ncbi:acyl carrier protein [Ralstonia insidiosa]|nr:MULTISPECIES: acyl carrier protein [Ralstonia]ANH76004.1 phosphopantetheine attachment site family protein [Ralstonia insidiosa]KAB0467273.1 acyl carrier protein [Ralstonia insidiosa]MBY4705606.1 acyl carrier protein [Ralstonia insidiosa]MBY4909556.1 acyl carrier protein [Ralstonia insidiosa]NMV36328.1 acyl carrier protein [Ralstonia insidiosa]
MTQTETLLADVKALVENVVLRTVEPDTPLIEMGLVDSVLAVEIVMAVEMQFGVRVPPTEIAEHLASVNALAAYIQSNR